MDPLSVSDNGASYFFSTIYRGLFRYHSKDGLKPEGATKCRRPTVKTVICYLNSEFRWSDGSKITANDYVTGFARLVDPMNKARVADLLFTLKNAKEIHLGKMKPETLGIRALSEDRLEFTFSVPDYDFEYKLSNPALVPFKKIGSRTSPESGLYNGPYFVKKWQLGRRIHLAPNPYYPHGNPDRPPVEALIIEEDTTATTLFETGTLNMQRRLPTTEIPRWKDKKVFFENPMARFDYLGFGPELKDRLDLRKALSHSLNYEEFKRVFYSMTRPGCTGLSSLMLKEPVCVEFDLKKAKKYLARVSEKDKKKRWILTFSKLGGDANRMTTEWLQHQWKKHLGLDIEIQSMEQAPYIQQLRLDPQAIFKKGVSLDRPTCLAALENLMPENPENYIRYDNKTYQKTVKQLARTGSLKKRKELCRKALEILIEDYRLIPMGNFAYSILVDTRFTGWDFNELNQLDLSGLKFRASK